MLHRLKRLFNEELIRAAGRCQDFTNLVGIGKIRVIAAVLDGRNHLIDLFLRFKDRLGVQQCDFIFSAALCNDRDDGLTGHIPA